MLVSKIIGAYQFGKSLICRPTISMAMLVVAALPASAADQKIPALLQPSPCVAGANPALAKKRSALEEERKQLRTQTEQHNAQCSAVEKGSAGEIPCRSKQSVLTAELAAHIDKANQYNADVRMTEKNSCPAGTDIQQIPAKQLVPGWQKALGCAMEEVYARSKILGADGVRFAQDLSKEMTRVFNEAGPPVKDKDDVNAVNLDLNREIASGANADEQFIVTIVVNTHGDGTIVVIVESYFSKSAGKKDKHDEARSVMRLDKYGRVTESEGSPAVKACLTR
jgi:hypothetical protein